MLVGDRLSDGEAVNLATPDDAVSQTGKLRMCHY